MKFLVLPAFMLLIVASQASGADRATTSDGRSVLLHPNGTWSYEGKAEILNYRQIEFSDFLIDGSQLIGKPIKIKGVGGFTNNRGESRPDGAIYQKTFTIGPSIRISSRNLDRANLMLVHECPLSCALEISGVVEKSSYNTIFIQAETIKVLNKGAAGM